LSRGARAVYTTGATIGGIPDGGRLEELLQKPF